MPDLVLARMMLEMIADEHGQKFHQRLCFFPALLRQSIRDELRPHIASNARLRGALERADALGDQIEAREQPFFLGAGPIEMFAKQIGSKTLSLDDALNAMREEWLVDAMIRPYVGGVAHEATEMAHKGEWRPALTLIRLLRAAVAAAPVSGETVNLTSVELAFVEIAIWSLVEVPDRRLLQDAVTCGERVVARTGPLDDDHGLALMRLGVLHLDPYVKFRDLGSYRAEFDLWHEAFPLEYGASADSLEREDWQMPPIEEALPKAVAYLRRAADARTGRLRGLSLKALAEALRAQAYVLTHELSSVDAEAAARESIVSLDPVLDRDHLLTLQQMLTAPGAQAPAWPDDKGLPPRKQVAVALMRAKQLVKVDPHGALEVLQAAEELFRLHALPQERTFRLGLMVGAIRPAFAPTEDPSLWGGTWDERVATFQRKARSGELVGRVLAVCAIQLASSVTDDKEQQALPILELATQADPSLTREYEDVLRFATYGLYVGAGANAFEREDWQAALTSYLAALGTSIPLRLGNLTLDMLERANDVLAKAGRVELRETHLGLLAANWLACEDALEERGALGLAELAGQLDRSVAGESTGDKSWWLWQLAKGLRFACSLSVNDSSPPPEELKLLAEIRQLEEVAPAGELRHDDETVLVSVLRSIAVAKGDDIGARLANRQHAFDVARRGRLARSAPKPRFLGIKDVAHAMGSDSALVNLYLSESPERNLALRWLCVFPRRAVAGRTVYPVSGSPIVAEIHGLEMVRHPLAFVVKELRAQVQADAGFDPITTHCAEMLEEWENGFLGQLRAELDRNPVTKHLVIVPHGPLHFAPLHLLGPPGAAIGEGVVVTYLPNLALLDRPPGPRREGVLAVGISFDRINPRGLPSLPEAPEEASEIAALFGGQPLVESEATPTRICELLPQKRYVHLATHGAQNAYAPAFHHLNLVAGEDGEDRLFAHNLDGLDLSGLELVTLSACETALGRFDATDNLRGLAASLFRCGARTIVGTLWPTGSKVCQTFFTALYHGLRTGATKRDAFSRAQRQTRAEYAEYSSWGAFYLMGDWW